MPNSSSTPDNLLGTPSSSNIANLLLELNKFQSESLNSRFDSNERSLLSANLQCMSTQQQQITSQETQRMDTCNCRKSKCLKLYCQCFAAKAICNALCRCVECENTDPDSDVRQEAMKGILERNPLAFSSKFKPTNSNSNETVTEIAHKIGCRCRKSMCLKKYCECFQASVPCSDSCTCVTCYNTNGSSAKVGAPTTTTTNSSEKKSSLLSSPLAKVVEQCLSAENRMNGSNDNSSKEVDTRKYDGKKDSKGRRPPLAPVEKKRKLSNAEEIPSMETSPTFAANELLNVFKVKDGNKLMRSESDPIRNREIKNSISVVDDRWENSGNKGSGQIVYATSPVPFRDDMALPSSSSRVFGMSFPHFSNMSQPSPNSMSIASALSLLSSSLNYQGLCPQSTDRISSQFTIPGLTPSDKRSSGNKNVAISLTQSILEASGDSAKRGLMKNSRFPDKENDSDAANSPSSGSTSPELDDGVEQTIDTHEKLIDPSMKDAEKHRRSITSVADFSSPPLYNRSRQTETHG